MSDIKIGKFQVIEPLGTGAHSAILHIRRTADSKNYALKVVSVEDKDDLKFVQQARHEFRVGQKLDHKYLVKIYALELIKNWMFNVKKAHLLLEYVNGKTLDQCPPLSMPRLVQVFYQIADAVAYMHRQGVYHADLKPNNILLSRAGFVKIIDFGLAHIGGEKKVRIQGTPEYMAPETASHGLVNERTDIFNFGVTMYRMVTFRLPPSAVPVERGGLPMNEKAWMKMIEPVQKCNAAAPPGLCDLVHRCLSYSAMQRPERMTNVRTELEYLLKRLAPTSADRLETMEW